MRGGGGGRGGAELIRVPPPSLGADLAGLLASGEGADVTLVVDGEEFKVGRGGGSWDTRTQGRMDETILRGRRSRRGLVRD